MNGLGEPPDAVSFSDNRPSDTRDTPDRVVSINGQGPQSDLVWLEELKSHYPNNRSELDTTKVVETFGTLPIDARYISGLSDRHKE